MKLEDLILPGVIVIGAYYILTKLGGNILPAVGGAVAGGVVSPAIETAKPIAQGGGSILELPGNIINGILNPSVKTEVPLAKNTVDILGGIKAIPIIGGALNVPVVNAAITGLTYKSQQTAVTPKATVFKVSKTSERATIPVSAININVPKVVQAKIKAGKVF